MTTSYTNSSRPTNCLSQSSQANTKSNSYKPLTTSSTKQRSRPTYRPGGSADQSINNTARSRQRLARAPAKRPAIRRLPGSIASHHPVRHLTAITSAERSTSSTSILRLQHQIKQSLQNSHTARHTDRAALLINQSTTPPGVISGWPEHRPNARPFATCRAQSQVIIQFATSPPLQTPSAAPLQSQLSAYSIKSNNLYKIVILPDTQLAD